MDIGPISRRCTANKFLPTTTRTDIPNTEQLCTANFVFLHLIETFHPQFSLFRSKFARDHAVFGYNHKLSLLCCAIRLIIYGLLQGCTNTWRQKDLAATMCTMSPNKCWSSEQNLLHITIITTRNSEGVPRVLKNLCTPALL
jgi:hypothetical protein